VNLKNEMGAIVTFSDVFILKFARALSLAVSTLVFLVPIIILYFVKTGFWPLGITIMRAVIFAIIAALTPMASSDILMATAALVTPGSHKPVKSIC
jgi:hypothetical protein